MDKELQEWYQLHKFYMYAGSYQTKELAEFLDVTERTIQRWLKEKTRPNTKQLARISEYLETRKSTPEAL